MIPDPKHAPHDLHDEVIDDMMADPKHARTQDEHSPTPWWCSGNTMIQSADNSMVARIQVGPLDRRTVFANADLVIRACNAHHALVEAADRLAGEVERLRGVLESKATRVLCGRCGDFYTKCAGCDETGHTHSRIGSDPQDDPCRDDPIIHKPDCVLDTGRRP